MLVNHENNPYRPYGPAEAAHEREADAKAAARGRIGNLAFQLWREAWDACERGYITEADRDATLDAYDALGGYRREGAK